MNAKQKGNRFENLIAKKLTDYLGIEFIRTPSSGALATVTHRDKLAGDIMCIDAYFPFVVECKHYKELDFSQLIKQKGNLIKWLDQLNKEKKDKLGLLIFKGNYTPIYCAIEGVDLDDITTNCLIYGSYVFLLFENALPIIKKIVGQKI